MDPGWVAAAGGECLEPGQVDLDDLGVAGQGEDQGDVDTATLGDHRLHGGSALRGRRDLHEQVGLVDPVVQPPGGVDRGLGVAGQFGGDLDRHEAVCPVRGVEHRAQDGEGGGDVGDDQLPVGILYRPAGRSQRRELLVVVGRALYGLGEDRRVGGHAADPVGDHAGQGAVA